MRTSDTVTELFAAMVKAQASIGAARKDRQNTHLKNRYATLDSVVNAAKQALADNSLAVIQAPSVIAGEGIVETRLIHASGEWLECETRIPFWQGKGVNVGQASGGVITYGRRYALLAVLGVAGDPAEDTDGVLPRESTAERERRQAAHDPTWEKDRPAFQAKLGELAVNYDRLVRWLEGLSPPKPRPSQMDQTSRDRLLVYLVENEELCDRLGASNV